MTQPSAIATAIVLDHALGRNLDAHQAVRAIHRFDPQASTRQLLCAFGSRATAHLVLQRTIQLQQRALTPRP